jgi:hypothetical protein
VSVCGNHTAHYLQASVKVNVNWEKFVVKGLAIMPTTVTVALLVMLGLPTLGNMTKIGLFLFVS